MWNLAGPEYIMYKSGQLNEIDIEDIPKLLAAKWFNQVAWNSTFMYMWLENLAMSTISATGNAFVTSWIMLIYLLVKGEEAEENGAPDLTEIMGENNSQRLNLIDGTFFHYF